MKEQTVHSICWDCAKAIGGCSWSKNLTPVEGWHAKPTRKQDMYESFLVTKCPEFERDAYKGGMLRPRDIKKMELKNAKVFSK